MSLSASRGTPFVGSVSLTPGSLSASLPIRVARNGASAYTLAATERVVVTSISVSSNDTTPRLVTITDGAPSPRTLWSAYASVGTPAVCPIAADILRGWPGVAPVVSVAALTAAKTVEVTVSGAIEHASP